MIEQDAWDTEAGQLQGDELPTMADPYQSHDKPFTHPEAALERVPRLREILAAAHQECNQSGETTGRIKDIFHEYVMKVMNHWTFAERHELEALAVKNAKLTTEE